MIDVSESKVEMTAMNNVTSVKREKEEEEEEKKKTLFKYQEKNRSICHRARQ